MPVRKSILAIGIKMPTDPQNIHWNGEALMKAIAIESEKVNAAGFDYTGLALDLAEPDTIENLKATLRSKQWDAFSIGFGLRANKDHTPLFETLVNAAITEVQPPPKMIFATGPDKVLEAIRRWFPEE